MNAKELSRFLDKTQPNPATWCIVWCGYVSPNGYAQFHLGKTRHAHRVAWEHVNGAVPKGLELDHRCRNRACVNPLHLEPVTHKENMKRSPIHKEAARAVGLKIRKYDLPEGVTNNRRKFRARAWDGGKRYHLGTYDSAEQASEAYVAFKNA